MSLAKDIDRRIAALPPEKLALLLERLEAARAAPGVPAGSVIPAVRRQTAERPMSFAQERLWFLDQLAPGGADYNVPTALRLRGRVDRRAIERGLGEILRRHEVLRTSFHETGGRPVQVVAEAVSFGSFRIDLRGLPARIRETEVIRLARREGLRPFDLGRAPLLRAGWVDLAAEEQVLLVTLHHIVCDGWSLGILTAELLELYRAFAAGEPSTLPELPIQYADYAEWQRGRLAGRRLEELLAFWRGSLEGAVASVDLPQGVGAGAPPGGGGKDIAFQLDKDIATAFRALGKEERASPFMVLAALFSALLCLEADQDDLCLGANAAQRDLEEMEGLIGFFINQVVLRVRIRREGSFRELLREVRDRAQDAHGHQDLPYEQLVDALAPERRTDPNPFFQVKVDFQESPSALRLPGVEISSLEVLDTPLRCDLLLIGMGSTEGIACTLSFDRGKFRLGAMKALVAKLVETAKILASAPDRSLLELGEQLLEEENRRRGLERRQLDEVVTKKLSRTRRKGVRMGR